MCAVRTTVLIFTFLIPLTAISAPASSSGSVIDRVQAGLAKVKMTPAQSETVKTKLAALGKDAGKLAPEQLTAELSNMAATAGLSGVNFLHHGDVTYWLYLSRFNVKRAAAPKFVGFWPVTVDGRSHLLFPPADAKFNLRRGDEVVFAGGPLLADGGSRIPEMVKIQVRTQSGGPLRDFDVPRTAEPLDQVLLALVRSTSHTFQIGKYKVGYLALPLLDRLDYRYEYLDILKSFERDMDFVVLDLRGPFGRGGVAGDRMFFDGKKRKAVTKPLFVLVDSDTAGGREELAAKFQRDAAAVVVGEDTVGDPGQVDVLEVDPGKIIMIVPVPTRKRPLTSKVVPDQKVDDQLAYLNGMDPMLERVRKLVAEKQK